MFAFIRNFLNGLAFGITETIPGVSGGTIAIILGFYTDLIETVNHFTENVRKYLKFLIPLLIGLITGILLFSSIMHHLLTNYSFPTMLFFIGLIMGIIPHIFFKVKEPVAETATQESVDQNHSPKQTNKLKITEILLMFFSFLLLITLSELKEVSLATPEEIINNISIPFMLFIFVAGIVAAAALVIPGISGSFVLLLLGLYPLIIYAVHSIRLFFADTSNIALLVNICKVLGPLGIGIIIGGLSMARLIEKLLKNYHKIIYSIICGLLVGSVCVLFKEPIVYKSGISAIIIIIGIATLALGCVLSFNVGKKRL